MSVLFSYRPLAAFNEFIESIQDNLDNNEGFGKDISNHVRHKNVKKTCSFKDLQGIMPYEERTKKSFSTNSFQENGSEVQAYYEKFGYNLEDHSTMASFPSSITSLNSRSTLSPKTANGTNNKNKSKQKNGGKKKNSGEVDFRKKYKTEVCKYWNEFGFCEFGDQCAFAHGNQEIRQKHHISSNYKTKKCIQFHETSYCPYGVRCQFIHGLRKDTHSNTNLIGPSYVEVMENPEVWLAYDPDCTCMQRHHRGRLPSFQQVSTCDSSNDDSKEFDSDSDTFENLQS